MQKTTKTDIPVILIELCLGFSQFSRDILVTVNQISHDRFVFSCSPLIMCFLYFLCPTNLIQVIPVSKVNLTENLLAFVP